VPTTSKMTRTHRTNGIAAGLGQLVKAVGWVTATMIAVGCGFHPAGQTGVDGGAGFDADDDSGTHVDASMADLDATSSPPDAMMAIDAAMPPSALCPTVAPGLVLCQAFDNNSTNGAAAGPQPGNVVSLGYGPGRVGTGAAFGPTTVFHYGESLVLDLSLFTMEMFARIDQAPLMTGSARAGVLDNNGQYSMFVKWVDPQGPRPMGLYAVCNAQATVYGGPLVVGTWYHLACTSNQLTLTMYVDGNQVEQVTNVTPLSLGNNNGTTLGQDCDNDVTEVTDPLIGMLDEVRLWSLPRTSAEIMAAATRGQ
jgi:Concanavalin A-like lectin/glucanases superfamily